MQRPSNATAALFGDWHGNQLFADDALSIAATMLTDDADLYHVGDFGLWANSAGHRYLAHVDKALRASNRVLRVVPGNHEAWPALALGVKEFGLTTVDSLGFMMSTRYRHIRVCPRTLSWESHGIRYAALSGANSIDFQVRHEGFNWWKEESPRPEDVDALCEAVGGRPVDVLITHDAPSAAIAALGLYSDRSNRRWSPEALAYANESAETIEQARARIQPTVHVCGHHHIRRTTRIDNTSVHLLADDGVGSFTKNRLLLAGTDVVETTSN